MRILLVTSIFPPDIGGPATYVATLAEKLLPKHRVAVVTFSGQKIPDKPFKVYRVSTQGSSLLRQWRLFKATYRLARSTDVIYSQGAVVVGWASLLVGKLLRKKTLIKFVGDEVWEAAQKDKVSPVSLTSFYRQGLSGRFRFLNWIQKMSLNLATQIITPSEGLRRFLIQVHGISAHKISVVPNAAAMQTFQVTKIKNQLIFVGRLVPWKHVGDIIQAVALARREKPWRLVIVGEGPEKKRLIQSARQLQADWVHFTGALSHEQTRRRISQSQILVLYSSYEGAPHVIIEAMLAKTAIIASDIQANREILEKGALGKLVKPFQPQALAAALTQVYPNKLVNRAYTTAKQKYSWDNHCRLLLKVMRG